MSRRRRAGKLAAMTDHVPETTRTATRRSLDAMGGAPDLGSPAMTITANTTPRQRSARGGVLVLGGGFAGAYVARRLRRGGATIVNPTNFMRYTPLLPEAAAGSVEPRHVVVPLRAMCPHADLVLGAAVGLDPERRAVAVESEAGRFDIGYERLVLALGSVTRTPPVPGLRVRGLPGWLVARGYHVLQLPFVGRRVRVLADWTSAALFRRDVAELSMPQRPS
jgi:hypothetical protein